MSLYPGGAASDPLTVGHAWWRNFLCDLTNAEAVNGASNLRGAALARAGMLALTAALTLFWLVVPALFPARAGTGRLVRVCGCLAAAALAGVPFASGSWHAVVIFVAIGPGLAAACAAFVALWRRERRSFVVVAAAAALVAGVIDAALYAVRIAGRLPETSLAIPLVQRLAVMGMLAWMAGVAAAVLGARD